MTGVQTFALPILCYDDIIHVMGGQKKQSELGILENSYYEACMSYLDDPANATAEEWAAYTSRITACKLISDGKMKRVESLFFDETETMLNQWWKLEAIEKKTYLQIVTGEIPIEEFDLFVANWMANGGGKITDASLPHGGMKSCLL